jgi:predicted RNase H-like HicB family nuclease
MRRPLTPFASPTSEAGSEMGQETLQLGAVIYRHNGANEAMRAFDIAMRHAPQATAVLVTATRAMLEARFEASTLAQEMRVIKHRLSRIETGGLPCTTAVNDLYPSNYRVARPIYITLEPDDSEYVATFTDADISASGDTQAEAVANCKDMIVTLFEDLSAEPPEVLGPGPRRQLEVLRRFLQSEA